MTEHLTLEKIFRQHGTLFEIPLNNRIFLHDEECFYWVEEGNIDIFALEPLKKQVPFLKSNFTQLAKKSIQFLGDKIQGALNFLRSANAKTLIFSFESEFKIAKPIITAISNTSTKLRKLPIATLQKILEEHPELNNEFDKQTHSWLNSLSAIFLYRSAPKYLMPLEMGKELTIASNTAVIPSKIEDSEENIIWLKIDEGSVSIAGMQTLTLKQGSFYYPLTLTTWFETITEVKGQALLIHPILSNSCCLEGLKLFNSNLINALFFNKLLKGKNELNKIRKQSELDSLALSQSIDELTTLFSEESLSFPLLDPNHIYRSCQVIGNLLNLRFTPLSNESKRKFSTVDEFLYELCHYSHVQFRRILLENEWWKNEYGPILCFNEEAYLPLAIIPNPKGGYLVYNPETEKYSPFNPAQFPFLQPWAFVFYRKLPDKDQISGKEAVSFVVKGKYRELAGLFFFAFLTIFSAAMVPVLTRQLFGDVLANLDYIVFGQLAFAFLLVAISSLVFSLAREFLVMRLQTLIDMDFTAALWQRVLSLSTHFFHKYSLGDLFIRMQLMPMLRRVISGQTLRQIFGALFSLIYLIPMFYYDSSLAWVGLCVVVSGIILLVIVAPRLRDLNVQKLQLAGTLNEKVMETLLGINAIRTYGCENRFFSRWEKSFFQSKQLEWKMARLQSLVTVYNTAISPLSLLCIFAFAIFQKIKEMETGVTGGELGGSGIFKIADFMGFYMSFVAFSIAIIESSGAFGQLIMSMPMFSRTKVILDTPPESSSYRIRPGFLSGEVRVDHIDFRYDAESPLLILKNISFHVKSGEFIAIVGHSGCGKSTLIRLLIGFETPENGAIYFDGRDLATIDLQEVRNQMGIVLQNSAIMDGTIRDNVMAGNIYSDDKIIQALTLSGFAEDLSTLPMGLDTALMNGGGTMSGGQKQRILIARALIGNPKILIFDEASSALDNETQEFVSQNLERLNTTRIAIAHRLSTIRKADRIYVMDNGSIVDQGTFKELSSRKGIFYDLLNKQKEIEKRSV